MGFADQLPALFNRGHFYGFNRFDPEWFDDGFHWCSLDSLFGPNKTGAATDDSYCITR
jgi:hypothetical protein